MGSDVEYEEAMNRHGEEMERIAAMREDNERKRAIEEMAAKYNYSIKQRELDILADKAKKEHESRIKRIRK